MGTGEWTGRRLLWHMAEKGLRPRQGNIPSPSAFTYLLRNHFLCGYVVLNGVWYLGRHEGMVSMEEFGKAQAALGKLGERRI